MDSPHQQCNNDMFVLKPEIHAGVFSCACSGNVVCVTMMSIDHGLLFLENSSLKLGLSSFRPRELTNQIDGFQSIMFKKRLRQV